MRAGPSHLQIRIGVFDAVVDLEALRLRVVDRVPGLDLTHTLFNEYIALEQHLAVSRRLEAVGLELNRLVSGRRRGRLVRGRDDRLGTILGADPFKDGAGQSPCDQCPDAARFRWRLISRSCCEDGSGHRLRL